MLVSTVLRGNNKVGICVSTGQRAASELLKKCVQFAEAVKILTDGAITYESSYDTIKFSNGSRILSLPNNPASCRGITSDILCIDESAFIERFEDLLQAITPTLTRCRNAQFILTTTPGGKNGAFYDFFQNQLSNAYVQYTTIEDAVNDGLKVDIEELKKMCQDEEVFNQEYMCQFSSSSGSVIDPDLMKCSSPNECCEQTRYSAYYLGMDIGRKNDNTVLQVIGQQGDIAHVVETIFLHDCPYHEQMSEVRRLNDKYHFASGYVDAGGIGSPIAEEITRTINAKIKGIQFNANNKTEMIEGFRSLVLDDKLILNVPEEKAKLIRDDVRNT